MLSIFPQVYVIDSGDRKRIEENGIVSIAYYLLPLFKLLILRKFCHASLLDIGNLHLFVLKLVMFNASVFEVLKVTFNWKLWYLLFDSRHRI